jgi:hypothetical protein
MSQLIIRLSQYSAICSLIIIALVRHLARGIKHFDELTYNHVDPSQGHLQHLLPSVANLPWAQTMGSHSRDVGACDAIWRVSSQTSSDP